MPPPQEESIYALIPDAVVHEAKPPVHRSRHDPVAPPSYSTFPHKQVATGQRDGSGSMQYAGRSGAIGRDVGPAIDPKRFLKSGSSGRSTLPPVQKFQRPAVKPRTEGVPAKTDQPVMGLMTEKNFVHANAVDVICSAPQRKIPAPRAVDRQDYGKTPKYLTHVKTALDAEKTYVADSHMRDAEINASVKAQYVRQVDDQEKERLIEQLRVRWDEKHSQYQSLPFARDTAMQVARKEGIERELKEIEGALTKLSKQCVYVYNDSQGPQVARWAQSQASQDAQYTADTMVRDSIRVKKQ